MVQRDAQRAQRPRRARVVVRLEVQVHHRRQRRTRLVQLAELAGRDTGAPLHRADQQPLVDGLGQLADLAQPVEVAAQQAVVAQRAQQVEHRRLVDALRVPQRRGDEAGLVVQPAQRRVQRGEAVRAEPVGARRRLAVDQPDHRVGELRVVLDQAFLRGRPLGRLLLVEQPGLREGADQVVQPVTAAPHMVDQPRPRQRRQMAGGLRLVRRRGARPPPPRPARPARPARAGAAAAGPSRTGRCSAATAPARPAPRARTPPGRPPARAVRARPERGARDPQRQRQTAAQLP